MKPDAPNNIEILTPAVRKIIDKLQEKILPDQNDIEILKLFVDLAVKGDAK